MHRGCFTSRKTKATHWQLGFRAKSMVICLALPQNPQIQTTNIGGSMGGARGILSVYAFQKLDCLLVRHFLRIFSPHWAKLLRLEKHIFLYLEVIRWFRVPWYYLPLTQEVTRKTIYDLLFIRLIQLLWKSKLEKNIFWEADFTKGAIFTTVFQDLWVYGHGNFPTCRNASDFIRWL